MCQGKRCVRGCLVPVCASVCQCVPRCAMGRIRASIAFGALRMRMLVGSLTVALWCRVAMFLVLCSYWILFVRCLRIQPYPAGVDRMEHGIRLRRATIPLEWSCYCWREPMETSATSKVKLCGMWQVVPKQRRCCSRRELSLQWTCMWERNVAKSTHITMRIT